MTSLQSQYLLWPPLACNTARTHQQPKIATSRYCTWDIGPWQHEKQHLMSQISNQSRHRQSETVSVKTTYAPDVLTLAQYWDVDLQGSDGAKLEASLVRRWIKIHAAEKRWPHTCLQTPEWEVRKELRPWGRQFRRRKCDEVGCHIAFPEKLDKEMRFWHHTSCPKWTSIGRFFSTTTLGRTQLVLFLIF